jgi:hypothetical protein
VSLLASVIPPVLVVGEVYRVSPFSPLGMHPAIGPAIKLLCQWFSAGFHKAFGRFHISDVPQFK